MRIDNNLILFSDEDVELRNLRWHLDRRGYARHSIMQHNKVTHIYAHREVVFRMTGVRSCRKLHVDHIDRNVLNNERTNLRLADTSLNTRNAGRSVLNTSGIKGISFHSGTGYWHWQVKMYGRVTQGRERERSDAIAALERARLQVGYYSLIKELGTNLMYIAAGRMPPGRTVTQ